MIANNDGLVDVIDYLCLNIENKCKGSYVLSSLGSANQHKYSFYSSSKIDSHLHVHLKAGLNLNNKIEPCSFISSIKIAEPIFINDIRQVQSWNTLEPLYSKLSIKACWTYPIFGQSNKAIGSISIMNEKVGFPDPFIAQLLETAAFILGIAITSLVQKEKLSKTQIQLQNITNSLPVAIFQLKIVKHKTPIIQFYNEGLLNLFKAKVDEFDFNNLWNQLDDLMKERLLTYFKKLLQKRSNFNTEFYTNDRFEQKTWFNLSVSVEESKAEKAFQKHEITLNCMLVDITKAQNDKEKINLAYIAFNSTNEGIMVTDNQHRIVNLNEAYIRISGFDSNELIGKKSDLICPWQRKSNNDILADNGYWQGEVACRRKNGEAFFQRVIINAVKSDTDEISHYVYVAADLSQLKDSEAKLLFMEQHDILTQLPNRLLFKSLLDYEISQCLHNHTVAVLMLDLNRFKHVNESLGHKAGDQLLKLVARRLNESLNNQYTIARIGGDEFAILLPSMKDKSQIIDVVTSIIQTMEQPFALENYDFYTTATIGISIFPEHGSNSEALIKNADAAVNQGKDSHRNSYVFYHQQQALVVESWIRMESALRNALKNKEFRLYFQPQIDPIEYKVTGVETLIRWQHPKQGILTPNSFLHILEAIGLMPEVGAWVMQQACHNFALWRKKHQVDFTISINASAQELLKGDIARRFTSLLKQYDIPAEKIEIEILETVMMEHAGSAQPLFKKLREMGIRLALDDFGTGHSSLSYLKQLPVQKLKIDRSMVQDISLDDQQNAIVGTITSLAHKLGMVICAEGVENQMQLDYLSKEKCGQIQGYFFAKPMSADNFEQWYLEFNRT